jgi:hypothetical protein
MNRRTDTELDDLEHYLVGLDELGSSITTEWVIQRTLDGDAGRKDVHLALQELLNDSVALSKASS